METITLLLNVLTDKSYRIQFCFEENSDLVFQIKWYLDEINLWKPLLKTKLNMVKLENYLVLPNIIEPNKLLKLSKILKCKYKNI